ncbi:MAG: SGNH/GDSL hydrolase family protein [Clostridia bacterium]|nr:SGNH/GDSL hydrolase family protein [Clostridia bacterium]
MKKTLAILIAAIMLFTCVGCGEGPIDNSATTTTNEVDDTTTDNADQTTTSSSGSVSSKQPAKDPSSTKSTGISSTSSTTSKPTRASEFHNVKYRRYGKYITVRGGMKNTAYRIVNDLELRVSFMGGSVTAGMGSSRVKGGFRTRLLNFLREECPSALFTETSSTLGGNGSQYGVYITEQMIASKTPDLVFIEYAVNNGYDGVTSEDKLWNHYETMIHTIRKVNPYADIVLVYVSDRNERSKDIIPILEQIADKYQLTSVNLHQVVKDYISNGGFKWEDYYKNLRGTVDSVHPNDNGYDLMAEVLFGAVQYGLTTTPYSYAKLPLPAAKGTIQTEAKAIAATSCTIPTGWEKAAKFSYGVDLFGGCIQTTETGKTITVKFKGTHFGVLVDFAKDAGVLEYSVDGGAYQELNCYLDYSNPKARMLLENAANTEHTITMRLASGSRMQIAAYLMNGTLVSVG